MTPDLKVVARRQAGCFTRRQALRCGVPSRDIDRYVFDRHWLPANGDVLVVAGAPVTEAMKAWIGVLSVGSPVALAAQSAGRIFGLEEVPEPIRPQLVVPNTRRPRDIAGLDVRRIVPTRWAVVWRRQLPVTTLTAALRDMAADLRHERMREVVQEVLRRRRLTFDALTATLGRGLPGSAELRQVLEEMAPGYHSIWERRLHGAVAKRGVTMRPQTRVEAPDGRYALLDLGIAELRFGVEIDGFLNHMKRFAADRRRARMLAVELDWTIAPYAVEELAADLGQAADEIVATVRRLRRAAA